MTEEAEDLGAAAAASEGKAAPRDAAPRPVPDAFVAAAKLAREASRSGDPAEALRQWEAALAGAQEASRRSASRAARASVLLEMGRGAEAEAEFRDLLRAHPDLSAALNGLLQTLWATRGPEGVLRELEAGALREARALPAVISRVRALIDLRRVGAARALYGDMASLAAWPSELTSVFTFVPSLLEGAPRFEAWQALLDKLEAAQAGADATEAAAADQLRLRLLLALREHDRFLAEADRVLAAGTGGDLTDVIATAVSRLRAPEAAPPKVFGIGLSRTGTTSLCNALSMLGYSSIHWANPLTLELIGEDDIPLFDAFTDITVCTDFEGLAARWPDARFIHTMRPRDSWVRAFAAHYARAHGTGDFQELQALAATPDSFHHGTGFLDVHDRLYFRHPSPEAAWDAHEARVRRFFASQPPGRCLEFSVFRGDGWAELCAFLGKPVPAAPFPWDNAGLASPPPAEEEKA